MSGGQSRCGLHWIRFNLAQCTSFSYLLAAGSLAWVASARLPSAAFPDVPTITETSVGKAKIGMPVAKLGEAYKGCSFGPAHLVKYGFDEYESKPDATLISSGQKLLVYWVNAETKKVAGLIALHPAYQTAQGIHVGSTSGQLKKVFPAMRVVPNMMMQEIEMAFLGEVDKPGIEYAFFKQGHVGKYLIADEPVKIAAMAARISWIQVYPH
jgi:hypothetical protein